MKTFILAKIASALKLNLLVYLFIFWCLEFQVISAGGLSTSAKHKHYSEWLIILASKYVHFQKRL